MITRRHAGATNITRRNCDSLDLLGQVLGAQAVRLDPTVQGAESREFEVRLREKLLGRTKQYRQSWTSTECFEPAYNPLAVLWVICYFLADGTGRRGLSKLRRSALRRSARSDQG